MGGLWIRPQSESATRVATVKMDFSAPGFQSTTTMPPPRLPAELLDYIVDHLHKIYTLKKCCLVSKSWIPRTRRHLFETISITNQRVRAWRETFPDPSTSRARYTKHLTVWCTEEVTAAYAEEGGWIRAFYQVVDLDLRIKDEISSFVLFYNFSPALKSLSLIYHSYFPFSPILNLIHSLVYFCLQRSNQ